MRVYFSCQSFVFVICLLLDESFARTSDILRVTLPNGSKLVGRYLRSHDGKGIRSFMGIPYAEPPVNELRFKVSKTNKHKTTLRPFKYVYLHI